ncbi:MAG: glycine zipper 2TM domain-containing protein [Flavobacterium sp.]|nr:glycine zipper 2TM domain-containing protein [Flavobacterium sp.]
MEDDKEIVGNLIAGALIGAGIANVLSDDDDNTVVGALIGAAIGATYNASKAAQATKIPFLFEEQNKLYQMQADGSKLYIRDLEKSSIKFEKHFKLK